MARKTDTATLPSNGSTVAIRQLSWLQLRASRSMAQQESARNLVALGGAEFLAAWRGMQAASPALSTPVLPADPLSGHDLMTVLASGMPTSTREQIEDLDEVDAEFLGRAILALTPLPRTEEQEKNGESGSIGA